MLNLVTLVGLLAELTPQSVAGQLFLTAFSNATKAEGNGANGNMVTMTLIQGIVNTFALFISRIIGFFVGKLVDEKMETIVRFISVIVFDILLSIQG